MKFEELQVQPEIIRALQEYGITAPTSIQVKAIPSIIQKRDVVGMSKTGSGKTAAFGIPILHNVISGGGLQVLILGPTRELIVQIAKELKQFSKYKKVKIAQVFGGVAIEPQIRAIASADIVVGTTGRLLDHFERRTLDLSKLRCVVLDEADKMVDMGFIDDVERIFEYTPQSRQILLFGATISKEIDHLKKTYMRDPVVAKADTQVEQEFLEQHYYNVKPHEKFSLLVHLLKTEEAKRVIIFCSTRATVDLVAKNLQKQKFPVESIHGKLSQNRRLKIIEDFHDGKVQILVASAVAARGLHIDGVSHVINYDLSQDPQEYIHRVGRTARAGESGKAITLLSQRDFQTFDDIQNRYPVVVKQMTAEFKTIPFDTGRRSFDRGSGPRRSFGNRDRQSSFRPRQHDKERRPAQRHDPQQRGFGSDSASPPVPEQY